MKMFVKRVAAIVDKKFSPFMKILGIDKVYEVSSPKDIDDVVEKVYSDGEIGVVIVQKSLASYIKPREGDVYPVIVTIPDSPEDLGVNPIDIYRSLIRRYIGYEIYIS